MHNVQLLYGTLGHILQTLHEKHRILVLLHEGVDLKWTTKYSATMNVLLEEVRMH